MSPSPSYETVVVGPTRRIRILLAGLDAGLRRLREPLANRARLVRRIDALRYEVNASLRDLVAP